MPQSPRGAFHVDLFSPTWIDIKILRLFLKLAHLTGFLGWLFEPCQGNRVRVVSFKALSWGISMVICCGF